MKSLESFSENVIGFQTVHAIIGHRVCPCDLFLRYNVREGKSVHGMGEIYDTKVRYRNVFGIYNNIMSDCFT